ncbi:MAG: AAA family ATPase [Bacteroidota bacterium]
MSDATQYWLFQANPKIFRLREALRAEVLETFAVKSHWRSIQKGDKVIIWQTGKKAGVYALAEIVSEVGEIEMANVEKAYFQVVPERVQRVRLKIEYNLWNQPITKEVMPDGKAFDDFYAGLPKTNYQATKAQYKSIVELIRGIDRAEEPQGSYDYRPLLRQPLNQILYGPPGTGKTYQTINHALSIIEHRTLEELELEDRIALRERFDYYLERGAIGFVSFHQSFTYEDFVEGIKPQLVEEQIVYQIEDGIFKQMIEEAEAGWEEGNRYVLIIDEVNRGNIAAIFGELITLLEDDKRMGAREELSAILPYSKKRFSIPPNLYIVATMNTADRSTSNIDIALRRRFTFSHITPQAELLQHQSVLAGVDLVKLLTTINERIALLLDRDFCIGHAYFYDVSTLDDLRQLFAYRIVPLLEEYFLGDLAKIGLVLGTSFIEEKARLQSDILASFNYDEELFDKKVYALRNIHELMEGDFIRIYEEDYE